MYHVPNFQTEKTEARCGQFGPLVIKASEGDGGEKQNDEPRNHTGTMKIFTALVKLAILAAVAIAPAAQGQIAASNALYHGTFTFGPITPFDLLSGATWNFGNVIASGTFTGNGAGLTNLSASSLASGTVSSNVLGAGSIDTNKLSAATMAYLGTLGGGSGTGIATNGGTGINNAFTNPILYNATITGTSTIPNLLIQSNGVTVAGYSTNQFFGNGAGLTNLSLAALPSAVVTNNDSRNVSFSNVTATVLTITLPITNNLSISNSAYAAGMQLGTNGNVTTSGSINAMGWLVNTNANNTGTFSFGQNWQTNAAGNVTLGNFGNVDTTHDQYMMITVVPSGADRNVTLPSGVHCVGVEFSSGTTFTATNNMTLKILVENNAGRQTNAYSRTVP